MTDIRALEADTLHLLANLWARGLARAPRGELTAHVNPYQADDLLDVVEQTAEPHRDRDGHLVHLGFFLGFAKLRIIVDQPLPVDEVRHVLGEDCDGFVVGAGPRRAVS